MPAKRLRVSCSDDENGLKLVVVVIVPLCEYTHRTVKKKKKVITTITRIKKVAFDKSHGCDIAFVTSPNS